MRSPVHLIPVFLLALSACAKAPERPVAKVPAVSLSPFQKAIRDHRAIAARGGWPRVPEGPKLMKGDAGERVILLRQRLKLSGDLGRRGENQEIFDEGLEEAVRRFQARHGLEPDGAVGKETLAALNVPVDERIRQLEMNFERRRELSEGLGDRAVVVNIPAFLLNAVEKGRPVLDMKVVVGQRKDWQTPLLTSQITYLILNPKWNVPPGIFEKELIHQIRKDPSYLARHNMVVVSSAGVVDPTTVDWTLVSAKNPQLRVVQREGGGNSLGRIKFMFPNRYAVFLHDTPQKKLFGRAMRALSHGCVRVEKPMELAAYLMKDDPEWARERIESAIQAGRNRDVPLPSPVDLHIVYLTAWVDDDGTVQFRNDIYGKDRDGTAMKEPTTP